ncbi:hypothetical protein KVT40_004455 [Elsinoe batatas]|uniref:Uncharacterized protein n=1 Tax=Elsinoe batatas TaxID=2601811 RepID=A0A8K0L3R4_9PEZI|nr:hypothetical protein KVT40_004455 [Elsinoe batatas]
MSLPSRRHTTLPLRRSPPAGSDGQQRYSHSGAESSSLPSSSVPSDPFGMRRIERRLAFAESWNNSSRRSAWNSPVDFHLLDYVSEYDNNLMCPICHSPFVDPVVLQECDHCFCRDCLRQTWSISEYQPGLPKGNCPTCRTRCKLMGRGPVSRILVNILDDLVVRCPKHEEGCTSEIKRSEVQNHVNNYCAYTWVECPGQECELPLRRKDAGECMHFGVTCIDCRQTTHMANLETHWNSECPDRKVSCDLCNSMVFYREISLHARESCPAITIPCTGATYGCMFRAKRGAINQHTKQCTFASFAPFLDAQSKRMAELEEQQNLLSRKMQVLEGGFSSVERILQSSEVHHASQSRPGSNRSSMAIIDDDGLSDPLPANSTVPPLHTELSSDDFYDTPAWPLASNSMTSPLETRIRGNLALGASIAPVDPPLSAFNQGVRPMQAPLSQPHVWESTLQPANLTPYTHLLSLHESLRDEVTRVSSALTDLDGRHSMMILNENLRLKEELAYIGGQVGGLGRQVGWLTGLRLQDNAARGPASNAPATGLATSRTMPIRADGSEAVTAAISAPRRRLTDEGRTKL